MKKVILSSLFSKRVLQRLPLLANKFTKYATNNLVINLDKNKSSISKSWASAILAEKSVRVEDNNLSIKKNKNSTGVKHPANYRRRLDNMSWTKEPMDDKLIWVDCEMTGLDYNKEMIMEIGCIITDRYLNEIARQPSIVVHVPDEKLNSMDTWCLKHHGDSGLTDACRQSTLTNEVVDEQLFHFLQEHTKTKECPMAGNSIYMDRIFIAKQFPKFHSHFHYRNIDVSTIKELVRRWFPDEYSQTPKKKFSHRVLDDILDSIAELKYYRSAVFRDTIDVETPSTNDKLVQSE
ncbi:oligoribonuclease isoform X2 [Folsomia candida]|uniref:oligoribonuclease isoform X2 n=1 Tax=Folsomia candida TaxID=158441 RepID=UPI000B906CCD|nr:oligoribonuclease isoform X2 [Folsomia candida]